MREFIRLKPNAKMSPMIRAMALVTSMYHQVAAAAPRLTILPGAGLIPACLQRIPGSIHSATSSEPAIRNRPHLFLANFGRTVWLVTTRAARWNPPTTQAARWNLPTTQAARSPPTIRAMAPGTTTTSMYRQVAAAAPRLTILPGAGLIPACLQRIPGSIHSATSSEPAIRNRPHLFLANFGRTLARDDSSSEVSPDDSSSDDDSLECGSSVRGSTSGLVSLIGHSSGEATFEFTAPDGGPVSFDLCGSEFDTYLRVIDSHGDEVAANDDHGQSCSNPGHPYASFLQVSLEEGQIYTVVVEGYQHNEGEYELEVRCGNDEGGDESDTIACGQTISGSTVGRSSSVGSSSGEATYQFVATERQYVFDACQSSYDSLLRVFDSNR